MKIRRIEKIGKIEGMRNDTTNRENANTFKEALKDAYKRNNNKSRFDGFTRKEKDEEVR